MLGSSTSGSTTSEAIIFNTTTVGTYYVRVIGFSGAFSATACYKLRAEISGTPKMGAANFSTVSKEQNSVAISPNPVHGKLTVSYMSDNNQADEIVITDLTGKKVWSGNISSRTGKNENGIILPAALTNGIYLLRVGNRNPVKFIKE